MKATDIFAGLLGGSVLMFALGSVPACGQTAPLTNSVSGPNQSVFLINGQQNPALTLQRGVTYRFQVNAPTHPMYIQTNRTAFGFGQYSVGVVNNGVMVGTLTFTVPAEAPNLLHYQCGSHAPMGGDLVIVDPPSPPPDVGIVSISVEGPTVTVRSTGVSGWSPVPEFSSNLLLNAWSDVPGFNNVFAEGTNTTTFGRLEEFCGPNVFIRVRNQKN